MTMAVPYSATSRFEQLITKYTETQKHSGNQTFLHTYVNIADDHDCFRGSEYEDAFVHSLLISLIAYCMGGAIRIVDIRGKDTEPISINVQDNMLHIENTPFRAMNTKSWLAGRKVYQRDLPVKTLPIFRERMNATSRCSSAHLDNHGPLKGAVFYVSDETIDSLFAIQEEVTGRTPTVVEAQYP